MLRPKNATNNRFFVNFQNGKCTTQAIGKYKITNVPRQIATYFNSPNPKTYTGHAVRRSSATLLADAGANMLDLQSHGGWASSQGAEGYIEESITNKTKIGNDDAYDEFQ